MIFNKLLLINAFFAFNFVVNENKRLKALNYFMSKNITSFQAIESALSSTTSNFPAANLLFEESTSSLEAIEPTF